MTTLLMAKQGSVEHALTVPEDTLLSGVCELMNAWEHKECFTFGAEAVWMLDLDGTEVEWSSRSPRTRPWRRSSATTRCRLCACRLWPRPCSSCQS